MSCSGLEGVECEGGVAYIDAAYHGAVEVVVQRSSANESAGAVPPSTLSVRLVTQRCPDGYCTGVDTSAFNDAVIATYLDSLTSSGGGIGSTDTASALLTLPSQCSSHRDQSPGSALCGACEAGYAPADVGSPHQGCVPCPGTNHLKAFLFVLTTWSLVLLYYVASSGRLGLVSCFLYYMQTIALMVSSQSSMTAWVRTFGFSPVSLMPATCFAKMTPEMQYAMPLVIVPMQVAQLAVVVAVHYAVRRWWGGGLGPAKQRLDVASMTYVRGGEVGAAQGLDDGQQQQAEDQEEQPRGWCGRHTAVFISGLSRVGDVLRYRVFPELTVSTVCRTVFLVLSASLTSVVLTCVSWFHCTLDQTMAVTNKSGAVVYAFPAVVCGTSQYRLWSWVMGGVLVGWLVMIAAVTWWMARHRRQLRAIQSSTAQGGSASAERLGAVRPLALRPDRQSEEAQRIIGQLHVPFIRHITFTPFWPLPVADSLAWDEPVCDCGMRGVDSANNVDGMRMESRRQYAFRSLYGALYDSFRPSASGWLVVVWVRRVLLIVLSVALTAQPSAKYLSFLLLHLSIACLHVYYQPFHSSRLNQMEQLSIIVHVLIAAFLTAYPSPTFASIHVVLLTLTLAPLITAVVHRQAERLVRKVRQRLDKAEALERRSEGLGAALLASHEAELSEM